MDKFDKVELYFQCTRCYHKFTKTLTKEDIKFVKCPRSCPAKVVDITDKEIAALEKHRKEVKARIAKKE